MKISVSFKEGTKLSKVNSTTKTDTNTEVSNEVCPYKFIKWAKQDQICGSKPKEGCVYCSRHKKHEGTEQKERKAMPAVISNTINPNTKNKSRSPVKSTQRVLRKHKIIDKLWHPETGLTFKSAKERIVIGKIVDDNINNLTDEDYDVCRKWGFSFIPLEDKELELEYELSEDELDKKSDEKSIYLVAASSSA